jgi:hypothetical protein
MHQPPRQDVCIHFAGEELNLFIHAIGHDDLSSSSRRPRCH